MDIDTLFELYGPNPGGRFTWGGHVYEWEQVGDELRYRVVIEPTELESDRP